jgi:hypothetical protein
MSKRRTPSMHRADALAADAGLHHFENLVGIDAESAPPRPD